MGSNDLARFFAVLLTTDEQELEAFRRRFFGRDSDIPVERLELVRRTLLALGEAITSSSDDGWDAVTKAEQALTKAPSDIDGTPVAGGVSVDASLLSNVTAPPVHTQSDAGRSPWAAAPASASTVTRAPDAQGPPSSDTSAIDQGPPSDSVSRLPEPAPLWVHDPSSNSIRDGGDSDAPKHARTLTLDGGAIDTSRAHAATPFRGDAQPELLYSGNHRPDALPLTATQYARPPRPISAEQFAWLAANVEILGVRAPFGAESGIEDLETWRVVEQEWEDAMQVNSELRKRVEDLIDQYRGWLNRNG